MMCGPVLGSRWHEAGSTQRGCCAGGSAVRSRTTGIRCARIGLLPRGGSEIDPVGARSAAPTVVLAGPMAVLGLDVFQMMYPASSSMDVSSLLLGMTKESS